MAATPLDHGHHQPAPPRFRGWLLAPVRGLTTRLGAMLRFLRTWSGDDAYDRYVAEHRCHDHALLSRREFYRRYLNHRGGGSRCC